MPRRILVVVYPYPPMPSVGGNRWLAGAKYLRRLGHEVTVLTTSAFGTLDDDAEQGVVRVGDLTASPRLRRALRRPPLPAGGAVPSLHEPPPAAMMRVLVPDPYVVTWAPAVLRAARRLVRERDVECVVTSSPYESTHLVGLALSRRVPWVADFRDGWTLDPWRPPFYTGAQAALDRRLERTVVRRAGGVLAATRPIVDDFARRLGVEAAYVPNGWDPDLEDEVASASAPELDAGRFSIVHTGQLRVPWGRDPRALFEALRELEPGTVELVVAGRGDPMEERLVAELGLEDVVRRVGHLPRASAIALQRRADALLLLTSRNPSAATGKLVEYLAAGRPILALADANEAARVVAETGTGTAVPPDDVGAIVAALRDAVSGALAARFAPRGLDAFAYPAPAEAVAAEVERAIAAA